LSPDSASSARLSYSVWLTSAGVSEAQRDCYMGHSPQTQGAWYATTPTAQLAADGNRLATWMAREAARPADAAKPERAILSI